MATHRNTGCGVDATGYSKWPQHTASNCNALQHSATLCNIVQHKMRSRRKRAFELVATHSNTQQHTATHCNLLQHRMRSRLKRSLESAATPNTAIRCNSLHLTATHCNTRCGADSRGHLNRPQHNTLQFTTTHCNSLQHRMWSRLKRALEPAAAHTHGPLSLFDLGESRWILVATATHCNTQQHTATHCSTYSWASVSVWSRRV